MPIVSSRPSRDDRLLIRQQESLGDLRARAFRLARRRDLKQQQLQQRALAFLLAALFTLFTALLLALSVSGSLPAPIH